MNMKSLSLKITLILFLTSATVGAQDDSSTIRIVVDLDGATLTVNSEDVAQDAYGNPLAAGVSFILLLAPGEYSLRFTHSDHSPVVRKVVTTAGEVTSVDIDFMSVRTDEGEAVIIISSTLDSADVVINGELQSRSLPLRLDVPSGQYIIGLIREGYEPLTHELTIQPSKTYSLEFSPKALPPVVQTAEGMGLERAIMQTPLDVSLADKTMTKYSSMAETFAIIPFGQGVMAKLTLDPEDSQIADVLLISGAALILGSYAIGKITSGKQRRFLENENARIERDNEVAKAMNREIDLAVRQANEDATNLWEGTNASAGHVRVSVTEHESD